jgi:hypothetical protein
MQTCSAMPGGPLLAPRPATPRALIAGMVNASLLAVPLWLLILRALGVI